MSSRTKPITDEEAVFWADIRKQFYLKDDVTYLQGGSVGPSARPIVERVIELIREVEEDPFYNQRSELMEPLVEESREKIADFVGAPAKCVALVLNTTMGMNIPAQGLSLQPGSEILMSDQEYPSVQSMWDFMAREQNVLVRKVSIPTPPESPKDIVDAFAAHITTRTQVMVFSHVYCTTGLVAPVQALTELAHAHGAYAVIDGAHAVAMSPVNIEEIGCDFYISSTHKWLLAPKGTGIAYIAPQFLSTLRAPILGYNVRSYAHGSRFDVTGTSDKTHFAGLSTAIDYQLDIGWAEKIRPYSLSLAYYLRTLVMDEIEGAYMTIPEGPEMSGFLTSFGIEGIQLHKIREIMWNDYKIQIATTGAAGQSIFRISTHFYDNFEDIDRFIDALKEVIATRDELRIDPSKPRRRRF
jgi:isopenicillin-N epimerase